MLKSRIILLIVCGLIALNMACGNAETNEKKEVKTETPADLALLNKQIEVNPDNADLFRKRALYFVKNNKHQQALVDIEKAITLDDKEVVYWNIKAEILISNKQIKEAMDVLREAMKVDPNDTEAFLKFAEINYIMLKDYATSFEYLDKVHAIDPNEPKAHFIRGFICKETGDTAQSMREFHATIGLDPNNFESYMQLGTLAYAQKSPLAEEYFKNALNIDSTDVLANYDLGLFYMQAEKENLAMKYFTKVSIFDPTYPHAYYRMGVINQKNFKTYDIAIEYYAKAIQYSPGFFEAYYARGLCFEVLGQKENAIKDYKKTLELSTNYEPAITALNRIQK